MPSLLEALEQKYGLGVNFNIEEESLISIYVPKLPPLLCVPELLVLNDCNIDCAGESNELKEKCRTVKELDLAQNNLRDWNEVFHILRHMPRIEFLNLSKNRFSGPISSTSTLTMNSLKNVVLNGTCLDWFSIEMLLKCLPMLEELHLSLNDYQNVLIDTIELDETLVSKHIDGDEIDTYKIVKPPITKIIYSAKLDITEGTATCKNANLKNSSYKKVSPHKGVRKLHFNGNPVEDWKEICRLGRVFPNLETLVLAECPLKSIQSAICRETEEVSVSEADIAESPHKYFRNLTFLNLSNANIDTWDDIDRLSKFPSLKNLRVQNLPLWDICESTDHERRQLLIARLPFLRTLNGGGIVTMDEREDAERAFIRYYMERPENERPLRYNELISKHGKLDPLINIDLKPEKRVKVNFVHGNFTEERFVDVYRTVSDLKSRLEKLISLPAKHMRLFYSDQDLKNLQGPEEMKFPNKQLYSYNIRSGDEILIVPKNF